MGLDEAFNLAATNLQATPVGQTEASAPQGQAEQAPSNVASAPVGKAETTQEAPEKAPEQGQAEQETQETGELPKDPKAVQRYLTKLSMAKAEAEKKLKEYEQHVNLQEIDQYNRWKEQQKQQVVNQPAMPSQLAPEQWNLIKDDPQQVNAYIQNIVQANLQQAANVVGQELAQIKHTQAVTEWERTIADFGEVHPDMWEMHKTGLFKPILEATVKAGGTLDDAYAQAARIRDGIREAEVARSQTRIKEKKSAASFPGNTPSADAEVFTVDKKSQVIDKAFDLAWNKKPGKVKSKN